MMALVAWCVFSTGLLLGQAAPAAESVAAAPAPVAAAAAPAAAAAASARSAPAGTPGAAPAPLPALTPPPPELEARRGWLKSRLDELLAAPALAGAKVSVLVSDLETGKMVYARGEKAGLNAASNVKLITSAAALTRLGPEYRWRTTVFGPGRAGGRWLGPGGELDGDVYLRGTGDPALTTQDLGELASELAALGVRRVKGALVIDATFFEGGSLGPAYDQKNESAAFRAPSSAASLNGNAVQVTILPAAAAGAPARLMIEPPSPYFVLQGRITTAKEGPAVPIIETEDAGTQTRIRVSGRVRLGSEPRVYQRRIVHPELYLGHTFREILKRRGIAIERPLRFEATPEGLRPLAVHDSPPLAVTLHELNKRSSNFAAEQVLRTLGAEAVGKPGSWEKGLEAVARYLEGIGIPRSQYKMTNGAGLYDSNRFTAEQVVNVLRAALRDFRIASELGASLAIGATDGTLSQRMGGSLAARFVRGKTGTLANVSCLSGLAAAPGQKPLVFSFLMNDVPNPLEARVIQDRAAEALVLFLDPKVGTAPVAPPVAPGAAPQAR